MVLPGRDSEVGLLREELNAGEGIRVLALCGPRGSGKTRLIREVLGGESSGGDGRDLIHFEAAPLTADDLLADLTELTRHILGRVPEPRRTRILPLEATSRGWAAYLSGLVDHVERTGRRMVLVLDGAGEMHEARRRLPSEIGELLESARGKGLPLTLLLSGRSMPELAPFLTTCGVSGRADFELTLRALPFRVAGWGHGAGDARDAFQRWAIFGDHPAHLPRETPFGEPLGDVVVRRILLSNGDLFDAPLRRMEVSFQKPGRYIAILRALSGGALEWAGLLSGAGGIDSGGQLAPYLRRLEEEGLIRADSPLDTRVGSRGKRYSLVDPFMAFWFRHIVPRRSRIQDGTAADIWKKEVAPALAGHFQQWMEEAARRWLRDHSHELFGAGAREVGALWGEGAEFPVAGLLANGHVCYGTVEWESGEVDPIQRIQLLLQRTRYGIGREGRIPVLFVAKEGDADFRRTIVREPLARVVDLPLLMGRSPFSPPG